jgi:ADP-heptose:LPS heptosyltransferase
MKKILANSWLQLLKLQNSSLPVHQFNKTKIKNVLFIELSKLGDVVTLLPAIRCFEHNMPNARLHFAIDARYKTIIKTFISRAVVHPLEKTDSYSGILTAVNSLLDKRFDLICSMSPSLRNAFLSFRLNGKFKLGYFDSYSVYTPFLFKNHIQSYGIPKIHPQSFYRENIEERGLKICNALGLKIPKDLKKNSFKLQIMKRNSLGFPLTLQYIVLHPFSGWYFRNWKIENFAEYAKQIIDKSKLNIVVVGSENERSEIGKLDALVDRSGRVFSIFNNDLEEMVTVISKAKLFVGNDSGPLHLASALGIPSIGLFGPATPELTAPRKTQNFYFHKKLECCPCDQTKCIRPESPCIGLITLSEVLEKSFEYLNI